MAQCKKVREFFMCSDNSHVYEASTYASCESSLLNNPTVESFRLCEVQVSYKKRPYFKLLKTLSVWMYSILMITTARVTCPSRKSLTMQLRGVGIVQMAPGCYLRTSGLSLPSSGSKGQTSVVTDELHLHLNLSELSPALLQHKQLMSSPVFLFLKMSFFYFWSKPYGARLVKTIEEVIFFKNFHINALIFACMFLRLYDCFEVHIYFHSDLYFKFNYGTQCILP